MSLKEEVFKRYLNNIASIRSENIDLNNLDFHSQFELRIKAPEAWGLFQELCSAVRTTTSMFVFYSDTGCYRKALKVHEDVEFLSYYELHSAIASSTHDIRPQQRIQNSLSSTDIVTVLDVSRCPDIALNAIRGFTTGALILLG